MAGTGKQVTPDIVNPAFQYFKRYLSSGEEKYDILKSGEAIGSVKDQLFDVVIPRSREEQAEILQAWIDRHVNQEGVEQLWKSLRQSQYQRGKKPVMVTMDPDIHSKLKALALRHKLTLSEMVDKLMAHFTA